MARVCQVTPATVAHWIDQGHLKGHRTPTGRRRVSSADLAEFLAAHGMPVPPDLLEPSAARDSGLPVVVLVEDDARYRLAFRGLVARLGLGVELVEAGTGVDGLIEIGRRDPALVVLDYHLPDLDAGEILERLLAPERGFDAAVVVVTGGMDEGSRAKLRALGVEEVVEKGVGMGGVVEAMRRVLVRRVAAARSA